MFQYFEIFNNSDFPYFNISNFFNFHDLIKTQPSSNEQIAYELEMVLSSVCARVRELQVLNFIEDSGKRVTTQYGRKAIVWQDISQKF